MKLSEKFARQESEAARLARIARRRVSQERAESIRQFLGIPAPLDEDGARPAAAAAHVCDLCGRGFSLPMHLGRHRKSTHKDSPPELETQLS
jgi:hypothetical protein